MKIFPQASPRQFSEVDAGSLIIAEVDDQRCYCFKCLAPDPDDEMHQYVVTLGTTEPPTIGDVMPDRRVLDFGKSYLLEVSHNPEEIEAYPVGEGLTSGIALANDQAFLRFNAAPRGRTAQPRFLQLTSGQVQQHLPEGSRIFIGSWKLRLMIPAEIAGALQLGAIVSYERGQFSRIEMGYRSPQRA